MCIAFDLIACAKHSSSHYCQCFRRQSGRALKRELTKMAIPLPWLWLSLTTTSTFELGPLDSPLQQFLLLNSLCLAQCADLTLKETQIVITFFMGPDKIPVHIRYGLEFFGHIYIY